MISLKVSVGAIISSKGKSRITIYLDDVILEEFRTRAEEAGMGYQTLINEALKGYLSQSQKEFPKLAQMVGK